MIEALGWSVLFVVAALLLLPVAIRIYVSADGHMPEVRVDGALFMGLCGLSVHWGSPGWSVRGLLLRWPLRWPALHLDTRRAVRGEHARLQTPRLKKSLLLTAMIRLARVFGRPALYVLRRIRSSIGLRCLHVRGRLGLQDPADTATAYGWVQALRAVPCGSVHVDLEPCFLRAGFCGTAELVIYLYMGRLFWSLVMAGAQAGLRWLCLRCSRS